MFTSIIPFYKQQNKLIVRSNCCYLYDENQKQYLDFESGDWAANIGHANKRISKVIKQQSELLMHDGLRFRNKSSEDLSLRLLKKLSFSGGKCAFLNSGSEAVNLAITLAKNLTGRNKILKVDGTFLSAYGHGQISPSNTNLVNIPMDNFEAIGGIDFSEIAAFVFEPGNSWGLIKFPKSDFIHQLANKVKQKGGFLMANEVTTGFGRTGKWFGYQHYDFIPDIVAVGKGLGNGYPISGIAINLQTSELFDKAPFRYAQSHQNDPLGCAIGCEVIAIFDDEKIIPQSVEKGEYFKGKLDKLQAKHPRKVSDVRGRGLMLALELHPGVGAENIYLKLIDRGFLVGQRENVLRFMPPLVIENMHIDQLISTIDQILAQ